MKKYLMTAAMLCCTAQAYAAHPLVTDDTGTQGKGAFQLELTREFSWNKISDVAAKVEESGSEAATVVSYGLSDKVDIVVGLAFQWYRVEENSFVAADDSGIGDLAVELKWRCYESNASGFSLALKPGITLPTGDEERGFGTGKITGGAVVIATKEAGPLTIHANAGYTHNEFQLQEDEASSNKDIWHASLAGEYALSEKLRAVADIGIETASEKGSGTHPAFLLGGLIYSVSDNLDLDLGVKGGLNDAETDTTMLVGMAVRFN